MSDGDEVWKDIPEFPGYQASSEGRVRNDRRNAVLTGTVTRKGYRQYSLRGVYGRKVAFGHRLVAAAFLGPPPPGNPINHLDGNKLNNRSENVEYIDARGNARHAAALGLLRPGRLLGERNPGPKLTSQKVRAMRAQRRQGVTLASLGRRFGVTAQSAQRVVSRKDWKHIGQRGGEPVGLPVPQHPRRVIVVATGMARTSRRAPPPPRAPARRRRFTARSAGPPRPTSRRAGSAVSGTSAAG